MNLAGFERFTMAFQEQDIIFCEYEPGDVFYLIKEGRVHITRIIGGVENTVDVLKPGEIFGEMAILENAPRSATAIALDIVTVLVFTRENFETLLQGNPQIAMKLLKLFTKRIYDQDRRLQILTIEDPAARIADVFLMLSEHDSMSRDTQGSSFKVRVSENDIAQWAGYNREKTRQGINQLTEQRRLEVNGEYMTIKNIHDTGRFVRGHKKFD